jgi:zinc transport system ATP-binding protein
MSHALHIDHLSVSYGRTSALTDVCLDVAEGEFLGIMGPNGGGKSTLLKAILGLVSPTAGLVHIFGKPVLAGRSDVGYVPQFSAVDRRFPISVTEVIMTAFLKRGLHPFFRFSAEHKERAQEYLRRVSIEHLAHRQIAALSGGEFQRLLIARALAAEPRMLLLDEPTASIDPASRECVYELLGEINRSMTIVLVTHDLFAISAKVHALACLNQRLVYHGEPKLTPELVNRMYCCPVDLVAHGVPHRVLAQHEGAGCTCHAAPADEKHGEKHV